MCCCTPSPTPSLAPLGRGTSAGIFPTTDPRYKGADSLKLLGHVMGLADAKGYCLGNVDATVVAQRPKLAPHIPRMRENIAAVLGADIDRVNVKATTTEELGFAGRGEGIAAYAVALMETKIVQRQMFSRSSPIHPNAGRNTYHQNRGTAFHDRTGQ